MSEGLDRKQFIAGFLSEAEEHVQAANAHLLAIEAGLHQNEPQQRRVRELFRALHTLKGLSAMVGVEPIVEIAHEMETILRLADQSSGRLTAAAAELLLRGVHEIDTRVRSLARNERVAPAPPALLDGLSALQPSAPGRAEPQPVRTSLEPELWAKMSQAEQAQLLDGVAHGRRAVRIEYHPSPERSAQGITITAVRERVGQLAEIVKVLPLAVPKSERAPGSLAFVLVVLSERSGEELARAACVGSESLRDIVIDEPAQAPGAALAADEDGDDEASLGDQPVRTGSIRVEVERLDDAMEKLSELVVTRFRMTRALNSLREQGVDVRELASIMGESARQLRDLRGCITRARMVPVHEMLERVPLIVRGMNRSTGKQVRLQIDVGNAELDKSVAERVFPAIVHLVRNAIDHAIEAPAERAALGKPEHGLVRVSCLEHSSSELELSVADDGRGIDGEAIARRAGRPSPASDKDLLELIVQPGFSTVDRPTRSSGRGMGMEIVQRIAVNTLGGSLTLRTTRQQGSTFTLRIPLSLSIIDAFTFACGEQFFVVPVSMVEEIIEVDPAKVVTPPARSGGASVQMIERRGLGVPLVSLHSVLALGDPAGGARKALVVRQNDQPFAFGVDRMLGQQEVVVRPLEDPLVKVQGVAGATDLGDGKPTLVLDLLGLASIAARPRQAQA